MSSTRSPARGVRAQSRAEFRAARRRRALTLLPGAAVILWSLSDLVAARAGRASAAKLGLLGHLVDHVQPIAWTLLVVLVPFLVALKPKPKRSGAVLAMFTGPVLTPLLFGAGGWRLWQIGVFAALVLWIESGDQVRVRRRPDSLDEVGVDEPVALAPVAPPPVAEPDFGSSLQAISGASFQSRSSS